MNKLLEIIYDNYSNLSDTLDFATDKEYIRFVYNIRNINKGEFNLKEFIKK